MSEYTYNITRWDGARFGPFATLEEAREEAPGLLAEWVGAGQELRFFPAGDCTVVTIEATDGRMQRTENLSIHRYSKPPVVEVEYFVVDGQGDEVGPYLDLGGAAQRAQDRFSHWRDSLDSLDGVRGKSKTFSVTIHSRPWLVGGK